MDHLNSHNVLIENQHGFRSQISQLLCHITHSIGLKLVIYNRYADIILLDFTKVFESVPQTLTKESLLD